MLCCFTARWVMAAILVAGAIPSGLAAIIKDYRGLLVCRFFIGILGSTFVSGTIGCARKQWLTTTAFPIGSMRSLDNSILQ